MVKKKKNSARKTAKSSAKKAGKKAAAQDNGQLQSRNRLLKSFTEDALQSYFKNLNGHQPADIYRLVIGEVEPPLFRAVMNYTKGNQTLASEVLGINRATLRKKLKQYDLRG